jgi:hypothetical protein
MRGRYPPWPSAKRAGTDNISGAKLAVLLDRMHDEAAEAEQVQRAGRSRRQDLVDWALPDPATSLQGRAERLFGARGTEYASEAEEIATYIAIEALAQALGDKETEPLARSIRREEERMRSFLEKGIPRLTKAVRKAEIPPAPRKKATTSTKRPTSKKPARTKSRGSAR